MASIPGIKKIASKSATTFLPQTDYENCILLLGHMRCGSTALSNILCSHPDINGYGECHVVHNSDSSPGALAVNQIKHRAWSRKAGRIFDKVLHNRLDSDPSESFFSSKAIFLIRDPNDAVPSILKLFERMEVDQYRTIDEAAEYYADRMCHLGALWERFAPEDRMALQYETLVSDPDGCLDQLSNLLELSPALENRYETNENSSRPGAGDPFNAQTNQAIVKGGIKKKPQDTSTYDNLASMKRAREEFNAFLTITNL